MPTSYGQTFTSVRALTNINSIVKHMSEHPSSSVSSICIGSGISYENCRRYIRFMKERGIVTAPENTRDNYSLTEEGSGIVAGLWEEMKAGRVGMSLHARPEREYEAKQRTVSNWMLHMVRDPLVEALFGPARVVA
jgi:predicted transcriptional regulator